MSNEPVSVITAFEILSQTRFFDDLSAVQLERVAALGKIQELGEGELVYRIGDPAADMYVLVRGMVRVAVGYGGRDVSTGDVLRRGDVFGWAAMTPNCNCRVATASCITPCTFLAINGERLIALMEQDHTLGYRLMTQISSLITGTLTTFVSG